MEVIKIHTKPLRLFFFWTGIIATISYRIIIVLNFYSPLWVKVAWYVGTIGFILYFYHRYDIQKKRAELVDKYDLIKVVHDTNCVNEEQKAALGYLVETTKTSKSKWNSAFIAILSLVALIVGIVLDILKI